LSKGVRHFESSHRAASRKKKEGKMLQQVSISQTQANSPGEDRFSLRITPLIQAFAVFDGHGGFLACDLATTLLLDMIIAAIESVADSELLTNHR